VLDWDSDPPQRGRGSWEKFLPIVDQLHNISRLAEAKDLKYGALMDGCGVSSASEVTTLWRYTNLFIIIIIIIV